VTLTEERTRPAPPPARRRSGWLLFSRCCFLLAALVTVGSLAVAVLGVGGRTTVAAGPVGDAPDYTARLLGTEDRIDLTGLKGEVLLLNTWATWCKPCRDEMPDFEVISKRHAADGLRVVGVNIDESAGDEAVRRFTDGIGVTFEQWRDPNNNFGKKFRVLGPPETFLVTDGQILRHWRGQVDPNSPENLPVIQAALGLGGAEGLDAGTTVATAGLLVAFGAGLISVLSPCVLPLIPSYASVIAAVRLRSARRQEALVGGTPGPAPPTFELGAAATRGVAFRAGLAFVAGFSTVFVALGVLVNRAGAALADSRIWLARGGGVLLILLGLHLIGVLRLRGADREKRLLKIDSGRSGYVGAFGVGVAFAAGWSPCVGPVLAGILTFAAAGGSTLDAAVLLGAYCAGLAIPFLAAALALDRFLAWSAGLRRSWLPIAERVSGLLVVAVGVLLVTGIFAQMAAWLA
jgi:cytochrome c-type biogenesis protein